MLDLYCLLEILIKNVEDHYGVLILENQLNKDLSSEMEYVKFDIESLDSGRILN